MLIDIQARIEILSEKKLIGMRKIISFVDNKTKEIWQNFMLRRKEIKNNVNSKLYSIEIYNNPHFFSKFNQTAEFEKWAAVEVSDLDIIPIEMETITLPFGLYAVFIYKGLASEAVETYQYIFNTWIPNSEFVLDDRPHFALMGEKYKDEDPRSEEEIWIPIKQKYKENF